MKEIIEQLKIMNNQIKLLLEVLKKQQKTKIEQVIDITCAIVSIIGIIAFIDIIIKWITGG